MNTQITNQHTDVVAVQPQTPSRKEDRIKNQSSTLLKLVAICMMFATLTLTASASNCVQAPSDTMVAWYPFDEPFGSSWSQNLATQNTGVWHGGLTGGYTGYVGSSLWFNGLNGYVESPSSIATNFGPANASPCGGLYSSCTGDFSIAVWIRVTTSQYGTIVSKRSFDSAGLPHGYLFMLWGNGLLLQLADGQGSSGFSNYVFSSPVNLINTGWHFVVVTVRRTATINVFVDDQPSVSNPQFPTDRPGSLVYNTPLRMGAQDTGAGFGYFFSGWMDELQIWNRVLTGPGQGSEMTSIYRAGPLGVCKYY